MPVEQSLLEINPLSTRYDGPLRPQSLNAYYHLPEDVRPSFLRALQDAASHLDLTVTQFARSKARLESDLWVQDSAYGDHADELATYFDPEYRSKRQNLREVDPRTEVLRGIFYKMIRIADQDQITNAVRIIEEEEQTSNP